MGMYHCALIENITVLSDMLCYARSMLLPIAQRKRAMPRATIVTVALCDVARFTCVGRYSDGAL